jgi:hypothetical protein
MKIKDNETGYSPVGKYKNLRLVTDFTYLYAVDIADEVIQIYNGKIFSEEIHEHLNGLLKKKRRTVAR